MLSHGRRALIALAAATGLIVAGCTNSGATGAAPETKTGTDTAKPAASAAAASPAKSEAPLEITGKFALAPNHGGWGTNVTATASGLKAQTSYDLIWTTVTGSWQLSADKTEYKG